METLSPDRLGELIASRRPGWSMPQAFYTDEQILAEDIKRIYMKQWLFAGHVGQIKKPGDYFLYTLGHESLIISRGSDVNVHAVFNVCRHRGSAICTQQSGHASKLVCPYHQWVYDCDGTLLAAKYMPEDFQKASFGLKRAHCRVVEGLIFVNFAENPWDFDQFAADVGPYLKPHGLENAKIAYSKQYDTKSNWKLIVENSRECYHCYIGHPEYTSIMLTAPAASANAKGQQIRPENANNQNEKHQAERYAHYEKMGLKTQRVSRSSYHASRYPLAKPGAVSESLDGNPVAPLMGTFTDRDAGVLGVVSFPDFMLEASGDYTMILRFIPVTATLTRVDAMWLVRADAVEGRDYDPLRVSAFWRATGEQDFKFCEDNQTGVNSSRYEPGPYSWMEGGTERFVDWYIEQMKA
jgi:Rieske 2Fe-2S family protein